MAERSYPTSEVRGSGLECQAATVQEPPSGVTPRLRSGAARRSHLAPEARGGDLRSYPEPKAMGRGWEEPPMPEARASGQEEQPEEQ